ncbi:hypothetical protein GTP46_17105 [Duganella sp. FT135W]|uniref:HlyD family efflux transporter periplasmic adaptor subunit n=1 Tax=Duganella flavida TaxID=2692175 RepID=A0A6L8KAH6_9BURK|nr:hypothetical protein [Duganella flavida]MYM24366.1 hypothetical protein [Duganella flavida]
MASVVRNTFFRAEVLSGNGSGDFGEIRILHSISGWVITFISLGMAMALFLLINYGSIAKNVMAAGVTEEILLSPESRAVVATIFVPVSNAAALAPGQRVTLHYDAYPYQKFGLQTGIVRAVDSGFLYANRLPEGVQAKLRSGGNKGNVGVVTYRRITLTLLTPEIRAAGKTQKIPEGLLLNVNLPQSSTPLSQWLLGSRA